MDKTIRRNEVCVIGQPRCDFVFSSNRTCFIAYGFEESTFEMTIIRNLLKERGIEAVEAGGDSAPAQNAFCAKICSKIIAAQFCVILLNNKEENGTVVPNANVNMEYGLMLGFNKYIIPFQRASQNLPFNVSILDTTKYENKDFEEKAASVIDQAIRETQQDTPPSTAPDQLLLTFLLTKKALVTPLDNVGSKNIYDMGSPLNFNLLNDFSGMKYIYFGDFTSLRPELVNWRVTMLVDILNERRATMNERVKLGLATDDQTSMIEKMMTELQIWVVVTSNEDRDKVKTAIGSTRYPVEVYSIDDVNCKLELLNTQSDAST